MYHQRSSDLNNEQNAKLAKSIKDVSVRAYEQKGKTIFYNDLMLKQLDKSAKKGDLWSSQGQEKNAYKIIK